MRFWMRIACLAAALTVLATARVNAAQYVYGDYVGLNPGDVDFLQVKETSVTDPQALFEAPFHVGNKLIFIPSAFTSYSANGLADTTSGTLGVRIRADVGEFLKVIRISETGDTSLLGVGNAATSSTINGLLTLTDINPGTHNTLTNQLNVTPAPIYTLPTVSYLEFAGQALIDLTGLGIREVVLNFNNNLQTTSQNGTTSFIQKKTITVEVFPEPSTLGLLAVASFALVRRRRKTA